MKTMRNILILGLCLAGAGAVALPSVESSATEKPGAPLREIVQTAMRHLLNFRKETPMSAEQHASVAKVLKSHRDEIRTQFVEGRDARRAMIEAAKKDPASADTVAAADKIGKAARDRALLMAKIGAEVRPLLTPEQMQRVEAARAEIETLVDNAIGRMSN